MAVRVTTQPAIEPVSLSEAKLFCRVDGSDEDSLIENLIVAARRKVERWEWRSLITQTLTLTMSGYDFRKAVRQHGAIFLPYGPIQSVTSAAAVWNETSATWASSDYVVDTGSGLVALSEASTGWPDTDDGPNSFTLIYVAGYGDDPEDVPQETKQAILLLVGHLYQNRSQVSDRRVESIPFGVEALLNKHCDARVLEFV